MRTTLFILGAGCAFALAGCSTPDVEVGRSLFSDHCVACHGTAGHGDGPSAADVGRPVPDLTRIAARRSGVFPVAEVMSTIDGYTRANEGPVIMPEFGLALQNDPLVLYDTGDGVPTPTPVGLAALTDYLRAIQE
ncbi:c-type cytochrome [Rhodobacterales bacterium HKCCE3408]|nr:c-type cytochrome [Rhodobacterales bacterium HKCCE3408]